MEKMINDQFKECVENFHKQMDAHLNTYPLIISVLLTKWKESSKKRDKYVEKHNIEVIEKDKSQMFYVTMENHHDFQQLQKNVEYSMLAIENISKNTIVAMVGTYDAFLGNLIRLMFRAKPEILKATGMSIEVSELFSYADIKDVENCVIERQVESVLRDSHADQLKWLEHILGIKTLKQYTHYKDFIEITERRNLFVHAAGVVSRTYLKKCKDEGVDTSVPLGTELEAQPTYIKKCHDVLMETGIKLSQVLWRKLNVSIETSDESLQDVTFDCLNEGQYHLAQELLHFATNNVKQYSSVDYEWVFRVNHALSYYLADEREKSDKIVHEKSWSALDVKYRLAEAVLLEDFETAKKLMHMIGQDKVFQFNYQQWPLFRNFRKTEQFMSAYEDIYGKPFVYKELKETTSNESLDGAKEIIDIVSK